MQDRVKIVLDVTFDEARRIAEAIAGIGPYYGMWNLPICLDEVAEMKLPDGKVQGVSIRSDASAALGGPE